MAFFRLDLDKIINQLKRLNNFAKFVELRDSCSVADIARKLEEQYGNVMKWNCTDTRPKIREKVMRLLIQQGFATEEQYKKFDALDMLVK